MSEENAATPPDVPAPDNSLTPTEALEDKLPPNAKAIYLVAYPKIVFLYPTFFMALLAGFVMMFSGNTEAEAGRTGEVVTLVFLGVLSLNLCVVTFDFPRTTSLTLFFFVAMLIMGAFLTFTYQPKLLPFGLDLFEHLKPWANYEFFFMIAGVLFCFYLAVLVAVQYDYWEVRPNELLHHHGFLADLKRYPAPNLRIDKEINDVFEYMLLRSGRLIFHARHETRAIVLDNVLFINRKEELLTKMLGALQVSVRDE
ncbi:MAG: hypothetical protein ACKVHE_28505 [Planctomycetales bacterium]|jgi:hypothetical protein